MPPNSLSPNSLPPNSPRQRPLLTAASFDQPDAEHTIIMNNDNDVDLELDRLVERLPEILRDDWVVIPKQAILQISLVSLLLGATTALMITGLVLDIPELKWTFPAVVLGLMAATKFWPAWRGDGYAEQLRRLAKKTT